MNDQTTQLETACRCAQFWMLRMSMCVASFMLLSTMVSPMLKVCFSLYSLLRSHSRSHLFVNCCIRRYSIYNPIDHSLWSNHERVTMRSSVVVEETRMCVHSKLLQSSIFQLLECNKLEVFLDRNGFDRVR